MFTFFGSKTVGYAHTVENAKAVAAELTERTGCEHKVYKKCARRLLPRIKRTDFSPSRA